MELMVRIKHFTETEQTPVAQKYMIALFAVSEHTWLTPPIYFCWALKELQIFPKKGFNFI